MIHLTSERHTPKLSTPTYDSNCEEKPAAKGTVVRCRSNRREDRGHHREAYTVRDKHDARYSFSAASPWEDTLT